MLVHHENNTDIQVPTQPGSTPHDTRHDRAFQYSGRNLPGSANPFAGTASDLKTLQCVS
jgi:hypothetical protein